MLFSGLSNSNKSIVCRNQLFRRLFMTFLGLWLVGAKAQFAVQLTPQLVSPYTLQLSEYYAGTVPKLYITLTNRDMLQPVLKVRLRISISGQTADIRTNEDAYYPPIILDAGMPQRLSLNDLEPYFNPANLDFSGITKTDYLKSGKLPEGFYTFCFEAVEINTNRVVSKNECTTVWISFSDPPLLNTPANASIIPFKEPTNIVFNWSPRHQNSPNGAFNTEYDFQLVELWDAMIDPVAAFQTAQPLYTTTTQATSLLYGVNEPQLIPGKKYGWRVKIKAKNLADDRDEFKNNGYSDVFWFTYQDNCSSPQNISANPTYGSTSIGFSLQPNIAEYNVQVREVNQLLNTAWSEVSVLTPSVNINGLNTNTNYEYRVGSKCANGTYQYSDVYTVFIPQLPIASAIAQPAIITDTVKCAYSWEVRTAVKGDLTGPLLTNCSTESTRNFNFVTLGYNGVAIDRARGLSQKPLANADVKLYKQTTAGAEILIAQTRANNDGYFKLIFDSMYLKTPGNLVFKATHSSGVFAPALVEIVDNQLQFNLSVIKSTNLFVNSFGMMTAVNCPTCNPSDNIRVEILIDQPTWEKTYGLVRNLGVDVANIPEQPSTESYNGQNYVVVASNHSANLYKRYIQNILGGGDYVAKITNNGNEPIYQPLTRVGGYFILQPCLKYASYTRVAGVVKSYGKPKENIQVVLVINEKDIATASQPNSVQTITTSTKTNANGWYTLDVPKLKVGSQMQLLFIDRSMRSDALLDTTLITDSKSTYVKDVALVNNIHTITGRVLDQFKQPVSGALISISPSGETATTNADGFFVLKTNYEAGKNLLVKANGYSNTTTTLGSIALVPLGTTPQLSIAESWNKLMQSTTEARKFAREKNLIGGLSAAQFGIGNGNLANVYQQFINESSETLIGIGDARLISMTNQLNLAKITNEMNAKSVDAQIKIYNWDANTQQITDTVMDGPMKANQVFKFFGKAGTYMFTITPVSDAAVFATFTGYFNLVEPVATDTAGVSIKALLTEGVKLYGTVKDSVSNNVIEGAQVRMEGLPYSTRSNASGNYVLYLPKSKSETKLSISAKGYSSVDTTLGLSNTTLIGANFRLTKFSASYVVVSKLSGYEAIVTKQQQIGTGNSYRISGRITLQSNDVFTVLPNNNQLTFKNIVVTVDANGNAVPLNNVAFEEAVLQTLAFGFMPVEVSAAQLLLKPLPTAAANDYSKAVVCATRLEMPVDGQLPLKLSNAILQSSDEMAVAGTPYYPVFVTPNVNTSVLDATKKFTLTFVDNQPNAKVLETKIGNVASIGINKQGGILSNNGIELTGYFQLPNIVNASLENEGKVAIKNCIINKKRMLAELSFQISQSQPVFLPIQKFLARFTQINVANMGTPNASVSFDGELWLTKKDRSNTTNKDQVINISGITLSKIKDDIVLGGLLGDRGFTYKKLQFDFAYGSYSFSYDVAAKSYVLQATGGINCDVGKDLVMGTLLPLNMVPYKVYAKDWSVSITPITKSCDFKVMQVNLGKILFYTGQDVTMAKVKASIAANQPLTINTGNTNEPLDATDVRTSWVMAVLGDVNFNGIPGMKAVSSATGSQNSGGGSVLLSNENNVLGAQLSDVNINITNPAFVVKANASMAFSGDKQGFEAAAKINMINVDFDGSLKFYYYHQNQKIELGASYAKNTDIDVGPITIHRIGGGFDFNTNTSIYKVFAKGNFSPKKVPETVACYDIDSIMTTLNTEACGAKPVITFNGTTKMFKQQMAKSEATIDFCRNIFLIKTQSTMPEVMQGFANISTSGVIYGCANGTDPTSGSLFANYNFRVGSMSGLLGANATLLLGYNFNVAEASVPKEAKDAFMNIFPLVQGSKIVRVGNLKFAVPNGVYTFSQQHFSGVYIKGAISSSNNFSLPIGIKKIGGVNFRFSNAFNAGASFFYNDVTKQLDAKANVDGRINGSATLSLGVFSAGISGSAAFNSQIAGNYKNNNWEFSGNVATTFQANLGNCDANCNDAKIKWSKECYYFLCTPPYPSNICAKACVNLSASFQYKNGRLNFGF